MAHPTHQPLRSLQTLSRHSKPLLQPLTTTRRRLRAYHSYETPQPHPYPPTSAERQILSAALSHVPAHGFSHTTLQLGARDAGYLDVSTNLLPRGPFELVLYHLVTQRLALAERVQFPPPPPSEGGGRGLGVGAKVRTLVLERLRGNREVVGRWTEALALMAHPTYVPASLRELGLLADEMWFLAGDTAVDSSWYTKRVSLSAVYSAAEVFMTQDTSPDFAETERFVDARLEELRRVGGALGALGEWVEFTGHGFVNVLRSKGMRI